MNYVEQLMNSLEENPRITNLKCSAEIQDELLDDIMYGGELITFTVDDRYDIKIGAYGDVDIDVTYKDASGKIITDSVRDKNNTGYVGRFLREDVGITDIAQYTYNKEDFESGNYGHKAYIRIQNNNWIECWIYDRAMQEYIDTSDWVASISEIIGETADELISDIDYYIKGGRYENE